MGWLLPGFPFPPLRKVADRSRNRHTSFYTIRAGPDCCGILFACSEEHLSISRKSGNKGPSPHRRHPTLSRRPLGPTGRSSAAWSVRRWGPAHTLVPSQAEGPGVGDLTQSGEPGRLGGSDLKVAEEVPRGVFWAPRCEDLEASGTVGAACHRAT